MQDNKSKELKCCKKDAILQAAEEVFIQKGYDGARMVEIANRAGVGHPLLHYHFSNKKMLFQQVVKRKFNILSQSFWVLLNEKDMDIRDWIEIMVARHFDFIVQHGDYIRFILNELEMHPELFLDAKPFILDEFNKATTKLQILLDDASEKGAISRMNAEDLLLDIISLNLFSIWTKPLLYKLKDFVKEDTLLQARKEENIKMIIGRLLLSIN